jgi:hypothetical protein
VAARGERHAIIAWRDDYRLQAAVLVNAAALKALTGLEAHLPAADTIDALQVTITSSLARL